VQLSKSTTYFGRPLLSLVPVFKLQDWGCGLPATGFDVMMDRYSFHSKVVGRLRPTALLFKYPKASISPRVSAADSDLRKVLLSEFYLLRV
jgi:hypothetical protein